MSVPEHIKEIVRQRRGRKPDDTSLDASIEAEAPYELLRAVCGWKLGDPGWADHVLSWAKDCGFSVSERKRKERAPARSQCTASPEQRDK